MKNKILIAIIIFTLILTSIISILISKNKSKESNKEISNIQNSKLLKSNEESKKENKIEDNVESHAEKILNSMSLEEKVAQMFIITPDALSEVTPTIKIGDITTKKFNEIPVGGIIFMKGNIISENQLKDMTYKFKQISLERTSLIPFISIDEEGGEVTRIASNKNFPVENIGNMKDIGKTKDISKAYEAGQKLGKYLSLYGFNVDFAPVADVLINENNTVVKNRSFGSDVNLVSDMIVQEIKGLKSQGMCSALKHFPGHGATSEDSHNDFAYSNRSIEEIRQTELIPFKKGIETGVEFIMIGHISLPNITGNNIPASLSNYIIQDILINEMNFKGLIITDAMNMGAIINNYTVEESTIMAVQAGNDIILMPSDFRTSYNSIIQAIKNGAISEKRIDESVLKIIKLKLSLS